MKGVHFKHAVLTTIDSLGILAVGDVFHGFMPYSSHHNDTAVGGRQMLEPPIGNHSLRLLQHQVFERRYTFPPRVSSLIVSLFLSRTFQVRREPERKGAAKVSLAH